MTGNNALSFYSLVYTVFTWNQNIPWDVFIFSGTTGYIIQYSVLYHTVFLQIWPSPKIFWMNVFSAAKYIRTSHVIDDLAIREDWKNLKNYLQFLITTLSTMAGPNLYRLFNVKYPYKLKKRQKTPSRGAESISTRRQEGWKWVFTVTRNWLDRQSFKINALEPD